jgi:putative transposase
MAEERMAGVEALYKLLESALPDVLREILTEAVTQLMGVEIDALCGAGYGERSVERVNVRNGYRARAWDTRLGTIEQLPIPKLRQGSYFPTWLLEPRRRAERALVAVVAESYVLGVSTRKVEDLVQTLGIARLSKSQVSELAHQDVLADVRSTTRRANRLAVRTAEEAGMRGWVVASVLVGIGRRADCQQHGQR